MAQKLPTGANDTPPNPLASNPLATIDLRWQRALKTLHQTREPLTGALKDVESVTQARLNSRGHHFPIIILFDLQAWLIATRHMQLRHIDDRSERERISVYLRCHYKHIARKLGG